LDIHLNFCDMEVVAFFEKNTFKSSPAYYCSLLEDIPLLELMLGQTTGANHFSAVVRNAKNSPNVATDPAFLTYLDAATALEAFRSGKIPHGMQKELYRKMNSSLRPCYYEERNEVIRAHLLISFFCLVTGQNCEFKKHRGFARTLLKSMETISSELFEFKQVHFILEFRESAPSLFMQSAGAEFLQVFQEKFTITTEFFREEYPCLQAFYMHPGNVEKHVQLECKEAFDGLFQNTSSAITIMCIMSIQYLQTLLGSYNVHNSKHMQTALHELDAFFDFLALRCDSPRENKPTFVRVCLFQIKLFCAIADSDLNRAREFLEEVVTDMDTFIICIYLTLCPAMEHQLHCTVYCLNVFGSELQCTRFQDNLKRSLCILGRNLKTPVRLIYNNPDWKSLNQILQKPLPSNILKCQF